MYEENISIFVTRLYRVCFCREPDGVGYPGWTSALREGRNTASQVAYGFIFSVEFLGRNYSNSEYVEQLYRALLGRTAEPGGKADWMDWLKSGKTRREVFYGFIEAPEFLDVCNGMGVSK